jgi:SIR2-like domain
MLTDDAILQAVETICDRLSERTATLFLGAGINAGVKDTHGRSFPLGSGLAEWIATDLLESPDLSTSLSEVAEIARYRVGEEALNSYLYEQFSQFRPGTAHLALAQLPWDVIYTTNYDLLVEGGAHFLDEEAAGRFRKILSKETDLSPFTEDDILYYKLHGSIDLANTEEGRLVLTREDYRHYELYRRPLFRRLERDLLSRTFVFVGYSLRDSNFRDLLEDCRNELGAKSFPLSFAVLRDFSQVEETFWREKYNIQLLRCDSAVFLETLKETWIHQNRTVLPFGEREARRYHQVDEATQFRKVAESFYQIQSSDVTGSSAPELFFRERVRIHWQGTRVAVSNSERKRSHTQEATSS